MLTAADGEEALTRLASGEPAPACVVLDLTMPRLGGVATLDEIRRRGLGVPVLLASGYGGDAVQGRLAALGAGFVAKPYRLAELAAALRRLLETETGTPVTGSTGRPPPGPGSRRCPCRRPTRAT